VRLVVATLVFVAGCLRAELVECGDKLCPSAHVCVDNRCVNPALVCTQMGAECDALGAPGRCLDGVCEVARCGDGFVDTALREDCDNSIPDTQCVDVGFDLGRPGCRDCQADLLDGCIAFGWKLAVNSPAEKLWTDGETFAYWRFEPSTLEVHGPGIDVSRPFISIYEIRGGGGRIVVDGFAGAGAPDTIDIVNGQVSSLDGPMDTRTEIESFDVTPDGTLHALVACELFSKTLTGEWVAGPKVPTTICRKLEISEGRTFVVDAGNTLWMLQNGAFVRRFTLADDVHELAYGTVGVDTAVWLATSAGLALANDDDTAPRWVFEEAPVTTVAIASGLVYGSVDDTSPDDTTLVRWDGKATSLLQTPSNKAITTDGERVYAYRGPIYEFSGVDFSQRQEVDELALQEYPVDVIGEVDGKAITVVFSYGLFTPSTNGLAWTRVGGTGIEPIPVRAAAAVPNFIVYSGYLVTGEIDLMPQLAIKQDASGTSFALVPSEPFIRGLWVASDRTIYAAGDDNAGRGFLGVRSPDEVWSVFTPQGTCMIEGVHAIAPTQVIAAGGCDGQAVLWRYDGTDWSELQRFPPLERLSAVRVLAPTTIVAVGPAGLARLDGSSWTIDTTVNGNVISGTPDDLWVSGSFTNVQHYDGTSWSRMTTRALQPIHVIAGERRVLLPGGAAGFSELLR
jgi:hypothetical protein